MARSYDSAVRRQQAEQTRRAVIEAALAAFTEHGWAGTTMSRIAEQAEVAVETVYRAVPGGKAALLAAAAEAALAGGAGAAELPRTERPGMRRVVDEPDPRAALLGYARTLPGVWRRLGPLLAALERAEPHPELLRVTEGLEAQRLVGMRKFAQQLDAAGSLRPGVSVETAADVLWTVTSRANHDALVRARGWPTSDYVAWVVRTLESHLLPADDAP